MKKLFSFTFCNSYGGFIYLAFIGEPALDIECERSCMALLSINLTIVFVVQILVGNNSTMINMHAKQSKAKQEPPTFHVRTFCTAHVSYPTERYFFKRHIPGIYFYRVFLPLPAMCSMSFNIQH